MTASEGSCSVAEAMLSVAAVKAWLLRRRHTDSVSRHPRLSEAMAATEVGYQLPDSTAV